jgi:glucose/mannose-6-phosphate isomerase
MSKAQLKAPWLVTDSIGLLQATAGLGGQLEAVLDSPAPELQPSGFANVAVFGMGGSGVAGAVAAALGASCSPVPIVPIAGYKAPSFLSSSSLAVAVSFSGETEETLSAAAEAASRGARLVAITQGGSLAALIEEQGGLVLEVPGGVPQPRAGLGSMTGLLLVLLEQAGVLPGARRELELAARQLARRHDELVAGKSQAAELARRIGRTIPLCHGASGLGEVAARRFKTQVNENAKAPAFVGAEPEVCHNELCGFGQSGDVTRQMLTLVSFRLPSDDRQLVRRFSLFAELVEEAIAGHIELVGEGEGDLACFFDLVATGDFASLHMAAAEDVDPGPVPVLAEVKKRLAN